MSTDMHQNSAVHHVIVKNISAANVEEWLNSPITKAVIELLELHKAMLAFQFDDSADHAKVHFAFPFSVEATTNN